MFICRHHLQRVNVTKLFLGRTVNRPLLCIAHPIPHYPVHARFTSRTVPEDAAATEQAGTAAAADTSLNTTRFTVSHGEAASASTSNEAVRPTATSRVPSSQGTLPSTLTSMKAEDIMQKLTFAAKRNEQKVANQTVRQLLRTSKRRTQQNRDDIAVHILGLTKHRELFEVKTIQAVLTDLQERDTLSKMPTGVLAIALASTLEQATVDGNADEVSIYTMISPVLLSSLASRRPAIYKDPSHKISHMQTLWALFKIIRRLIHLEQYKAVMPIFDELVKSGAIPAKAMVGLPSSGFAHIVLTVLLRCCIDFGWRSRAAYILLETPQWDQARSPMFNRVLDEVVDFVLDSEEEPNTPGLAAALMVRIANNPEVITLPDHVVVRFYEVLRKHRLREQALAFYRVTRAPAILEKFRYPPPKGDSFMWLFRFAAGERQIHVARLLVKDLVDEDIKIPQLARSFVVSEAAVRGFMGYARTLWERWKKDVFVVGDGGTALRLVSITRNRISALEHKARTQERQMKPPSKVALGESDGDTNEASEPLQADLDLAQDVTLSTVEAVPDSPAARSPADAPEEEHSSLSYEERIADYRTFAEDVVKTFRGIHEPLERAPHKTLNALARVYIMMDDVEEGFAMLKIIIQRGQVPDVRDVNVALSALSSQNPRAASRILERMIRLGIEPSVVSFGTVIHHALLKDDMTLVSALITRSRQVGIAQLDYKTIGTLIRSAISVPYDEKSPNRQQLRKVEDLVYSLTDAGYAVSPAIATDCIHTALRADKPVTAFEFWQLLVDGKVEHTDKQQVALRTRIARNLVRHVRAGVLREASSRSMIWELGLRPSSNGRMSWLEEEGTEQEQS